MHHCPTWKWDSGDESKLKPYLPKDKQYLLTKNGMQYFSLINLEALHFFFSKNKGLHNLKAFLTFLFYKNKDLRYSYFFASLYFRKREM